MTPEFFIAMLPLNKIIGTEKFRLTKKDLLKAIDYHKLIKSMVSTIIAGDKIEMAQPLAISDATQLHEKLINLDASQRLQEIYPELNNTGIDPLVFGPLAANIIEILQAAIPSAEMSDDSFLNIPPVKPTFSNLMTMLWTARIAESPLWMLKLLSDGTATVIDVESVQTMYPELFDIIVEEVINQITEKFTIKTSIPRKLKLQLQTLLGTPILNMGSIEAYALGNQDQDMKPKDILMKTSKREAGQT